MPGLVEGMAEISWRTDLSCNRDTQDPNPWKLVGIESKPMCGLIFIKRTLLQLV
jgi:hypothetical protein